MTTFVSLIIIAVGLAMVIKSEAIYDFFGSVAWAEKYLGAEGGSRLFYKLLGILIIALTFMYWAGILQNILVWIFGPAGMFFGKK
ncbi:MAG: hypothetical protein WCW02_04735 [Candidatus Buchananbacteria bacterium]